MKLIIKADDFGTTKGVTDGILDAMHNGVVTDTSLLVNSPHLNYAVEQAHNYGIHKMGLHLTLTYRKPVSAMERVPSLVDQNGDFYSNPKDLQHTYTISEVEHEFREQIKRFEQTGLELTHLDSHHHIHRILGEDIALLVATLAEELSVPVRKFHVNQEDFLSRIPFKTTNYFIDGFGGSIENSSEERLIILLEDYVGKEGTLELMTHPGYPDEELYHLSSWHDGRLEEIKTLTSPSFIQFLELNGFDLIDFTKI